MDPDMYNTGMAPGDNYQNYNPASSDLTGLGIHHYPSNPYNYTPANNVQNPFTIDNLNNPINHNIYSNFPASDFPTRPTQPPSPPYSGNSAQKTRTSNQTDVTFAKMPQSGDPPTYARSSFEKSARKQDPAYPPDLSEEDGSVYQFEPDGSSDDDLFVGDTAYDQHGDTVMAGLESQGAHRQSLRNQHQSHSASRGVNHHTMGRVHTAQDHPSTSSAISRRGKTGLKSASRRRPRKCGPEEDPENRLIMRLRTEERLSWQDIVSIINDKRLKNFKEANVTEAAVYGRFKRNAPRIAQMEGIKNFNVGDWMHMVPTKAETQVGGARKNVMAFRIGRLSTGAANAANDAGLDDVNNDDGDAGGQSQLHHPRTTSVRHTTQHDGRDIASTHPSSGAANGMFSEEDDAVLLEVYEQSLQGIWSTVAQELSARTGKGFHEEACASRMLFLDAKEQQR